MYSRFALVQKLKSMLLEKIIEIAKLLECILRGVFTIAIDLIVIIFITLGLLSYAIFGGLD